jgi:uncharacterized membrane protein
LDDQRADVFDHPLHFASAAGPMWLYAGLFPPQVGVSGFSFPNARPDYGPGVRPVVNGPYLGADGGREFAGFGPADVIPLFDGTRVESELLFSSTGLGLDATALTSGVAARLGDASSVDRLDAFSLNADRPVVVLPTLGDSGVLAGRPAFLSVDVERAEFRGFLVDVAAANGLEPLTGSTFPGASVTYDLMVTNLGRGVGGQPLSDRVDLSAVGVPAGWSAVFDRMSLDLSSGASGLVHLTVRPGAEASAGSVGAIAVVATSRGNPQMQDSLATVTVVKRSFEVGLWFEDAFIGPKTLVRGAAAGATLDYRVVVQNLGSSADTVGFELTAPEPGWQTLVLDDGVEVASLALAAGEAHELALRVIAPAGISEGLAVDTLTARSLSSPSALDRITATTKVTAPSDLVVEAENLTVRALPGTEAVFSFLLRNEGRGGTQVDVEVQGPDAAPWGASSLFFTDPVTGERIDASGVFLGAGDEVRLGLAVPVSANASALESATLRFGATAASTGAATEAFFTALVAPVHDLVVDAGVLPFVAAQAMGNVTVPLSVTNAGNLDERLTLRPVDLPVGWTAAAWPDAAVARNATVPMPVGLVVPAGTPKGLYDLRFELVTGDGNTTRLELPVRIGVASDVSVDAPEVLDAQPGESLAVPVRVSNRGNVPVVVAQLEDEQEAWSSDASAAETLVPAGSTVSLVFVLEVPRDATSGESEHRIRLALRPDDASLVDSEEVVGFSVRVDRAELALGPVKSAKAAAGVLVHARVDNTGNRTAESARVVLLRGGQVVDEQVVSRLPAGTSAQVVMLAPVGTDGDLFVRLDPADAVVETNEADNERRVDPPGASTPGPGLAALLVGMAFMVLVRRRRR